MGKKIIDFIKSLKDIVDLGVTLGVKGALFTAALASVLSWVLAWADWAKGASIAVLLCVLIGALFAISGRRTQAAESAQAAATEKLLTEKLEETEKKLAAEVLNVRGLRGLLSGALWQPDVALLFDLIIPGEQHAVTVKGPSQLAAVARITVGIRVRVLAPFAVTVKQLDFKLWCTGPGITLGSPKLTRHTGWGPLGKQETRTYEIDVELDGSKIGFDALRDHARITIADGTAIVASDKWNGDSPVGLHCAGHGLLYNEIPAPKPKANVPAAPLPSLTVKAKPRPI